MQLLFIVPRFHVNLSYRLEALQKAGYTVSLAVLYRGGSENESDTEPSVIGSHVSPRTFPSPVKLFKLIKKTQPDVIFVRGTKSFFTLITILVVWLSGKQLKLLVQTDKHDGVGFYRRLALFVLTRILRVEHIVSPLQNTLPSSNRIFAYAPFAISTPDCKKTFVSEGAMRIMTVGKFQGRKGQMLLLKLFKRLYDEGVNLRLTIVGETYDDQEEERVRDFIKERNLSERVTILTHLSHKEVRELYCEHDLFVLPSWNEPAAFSPLEAMAAGLPVIVSDTCGTKCYVKEGINGYIFKSKDEDDLYRKIKQVLEGNTSMLGEQSLKLARENHSLESYAKHMTDILKP